MTIVLISVGFFAFGLVMVVLFRSAVSADDDLERRWIEAVHERRPPPETPGDAESPGRDVGPSEEVEPEEPS